MHNSPRSKNCAHVVIAAVLLAAFSWTILVSASPQLHQRIHPDANRVEHNCAATMIASGNYNHAAQPPVVSAPAAAVQFSEIPVLTPRWVRSPFLGACIFEHAPPAVG
jgi:hypothetical protein